MTFSYFVLALSLFALLVSAMNLVNLKRTTRCDHDWIAVMDMTGRTCIKYGCILCGKEVPYLPGEGVPDKEFEKYRLKLMRKR